MDSFVKTIVDEKQKISINKTMTAARLVHKLQWIMLSRVVEYIGLNVPSTWLHKNWQHSSKKIKYPANWSHTPRSISPCRIRWEFVVSCRNPGHRIPTGSSGCRNGQDPAESLKIRHFPTSRTACRNPVAKKSSEFNGIDRFRCTHLDLGSNSPLCSTDRYESIP